MLKHICDNIRVKQFISTSVSMTKFGDPGSGIGQLDLPSDVFVAGDGNAYVCDWANNRVQIFAPEGAFLTSILGDAQELSKWAQFTIGTNHYLITARRRVNSVESEWRFSMPTGVTFDLNKSRLIVPGTQKYRLQIYKKLKDYIEPQFNL